MIWIIYCKLITLVCPIGIGIIKILGKYIFFNLGIVLLLFWNYFHTDNINNSISAHLLVISICSFADNKENLYANIEHGSVKSSKTELNTHNSSTQNLSDTSSILNRSAQNINASHMSTSTNISAGEPAGTLGRKGTFVQNKNASMNTTTTSSSSYVDKGNLTNETCTDASSTSNTSANKTKKKRWGILIGRSKSGEKVKSATLGREKKKEDKNQTNNKHRWSTGLPRFNPLPPSISKETMVSV